jgi:hypothetical protein
MDNEWTIAGDPTCREERLKVNKVHFGCLGKTNYCTVISANILREYGIVILIVAQIGLLAGRPAIQPLFPVYKKSTAYVPEM